MAMLSCFVLGFTGSRVGMVLLLRRPYRKGSYRLVKMQGRYPSVSVDRRSLSIPICVTGDNNVSDEGPNALFHTLIYCCDLTGLGCHVGNDIQVHK